MIIDTLLAEKKLVWGNWLWKERIVRSQFSATYRSPKTAGLGWLAIHGEQRL